MKYIIVGCGRVGSTLAKLLVAEGHNVTVVDENPAAFKRLGNRFTGQVELGTGIDAEVIRRAGGERADGFIAVTNGDNRNVMAALIAQRMFKIKTVVARIYDPPRGEMYQELGIETVCPTTVGAQIIRDRLAGSTAESLGTFDYGTLSSLRSTVPENLAGRKVGDVESAGQVRIVAVRSGATVRIAAPDDVLKAGDEINAIVGPDALSEFAKGFADARPSAEKVGT